MTYEQLDFIADCYIPFLFLLFLIRVGRRMYRHWPERSAEMFACGYLVGLLIIAYGLMLVDNTLQLWPRMGLDYSTHTAVALVLVIGLSVVLPSMWRWFAFSLLVYAGLMLYQQYHSVMDMVSTGVVIGMLAALLYKLAAMRVTEKTNGA